MEKEVARITRRIAALDKRIEVAGWAVAREQGKRRAKGQRIQAVAESKARAKRAKLETEQLILQNALRRLSEKAIA